MRRYRFTIAAAMLAALVVVAHASIGRLQLGGSSASSPTPPPTVQYPLGMNLMSTGYSDPQQPYLNLLRYAQNESSNVPIRPTGWFTTKFGTFDTDEESYLQLDSDGYVTSLTASPTPPGGQQFTYVQTLLDVSQPTPPGATYPYPAGAYRLKYEGLGTVVLSGDGCNLTLTNTTPNSYTSGTCTVTPSGGMTLEITAINSGTDYPRDISVVLDSQAAAYDAGAIFSPQFLAAMANFASVRLMQLENIDSQFEGYNASGNAISSGATSMTLSSAWPNRSCTCSVRFNDGEGRTVTFTLGSSNATWSGGLSNAISSSFGSQGGLPNFWVDLIPTWATRPLPSNAFWDGPGGMPLEIQIALLNKLGIQGFFDVPLLYSDADIDSMAQAVMSGTGLVSGYSGLGLTQTAIFELSNEVWNGTYAQFQLAGSMGGYTWPGQTAGGSNAQWNFNWYGMRTAQMAQDIKTAVGTSSFARVNPTLGAQAGNTYTASQGLSTPYWSSGPATNYPIKSVAIAPYWGGDPSSSDCTTMTSVATPLNDFFAAMTSNVGTSANGSHTYSSISSTGWLGSVESSQIAGYASFIRSYPSLTLIAYEGGQNFFADSTCSGWASLVTSAERDPRMGAAYTNFINYWATNVGADVANINETFALASGINNYGAWGALESVMQTLSPLSSAPAKWAAEQSYMLQ